MITKQALISYIRSMLPQTQLTSVDQDAVDLVNAILDKVLEKLFPKGSSAVLLQVKNRVDKLAETPGSVFEDLKAAHEDDISVTGLPLSSVNRAIRSHAGNVSVPPETQRYVDNMLGIVLGLVPLNEDTEGLVPLVATKLEGKHIIKYLFETQEGLRNPLHNPPVGLLDKEGKKKRKSGSRKRCSPRQISVRGFVRDGKKVKSYCRKKSSKK